MERGGVAALRILDRCLAGPLRQNVRQVAPAGARFLNEDRDDRGLTEEMIERTLVRALPYSRQMKLANACCHMQHAHHALGCLA